MDINLYQVWFSRGSMFEAYASSRLEAIEIVKELHPECVFWDILKVEKVKID